MHARIAIVVLLLCGLAVVASAERFTIAVISDTQNYTDYRHQTAAGFPIDQADIYHRQMQWIADRGVNNGGSIAFATHVGDLWQNYGTANARNIEIPIAEAAMSRLDDALPYSVVAGNHDYDVRSAANGTVDGGTLFNQYFGPDSRHFAGQSWYRGSFNNGMNSYQIFDGGGRQMLHLGLELEPSDAALAWAQGVIDANPGLPTIVTTHEYLCFAYDYTSPGTAWRLEDTYRLGYDRNTPQELWDEFLSKNQQIFMVLCGHNYNGADLGESARTDLNDAGYKVYQLLSDYQGRTEIWDQLGVDRSVYKTNRGGDGWLRLMEFDFEAGKIYVSTYSTELGRYETDPDSLFEIWLEPDFETRFTSIPEPATMGILAAGAFVLLARRHNRR